MFSPTSQLPDNPTNTRVRWLNADEQAIACLRVDRVRKLPPTTLSWACVKRVIKSSRTWAFTISYATWSWSQNSNSWIILFLKAVKNADGTKRFSIPELNAIPIGGCKSADRFTNERRANLVPFPSLDVLQIFAMLFFAWLSDKTGHRATLVIVQQVTLLIGTITLSVWPASFGVKMWAYFMLWLSNAAGPTLVVSSGPLLSPPPAFFLSFFCRAQTHVSRSLYPGLDGGLHPFA